MSWREEATRILSRYGSVQPVSHCDFGREENADCVSVLVDVEEGEPPSVGPYAVDVLHEVRAALPANTVAWLGTTRWLGERRHEGQVELCVGPGKDQLDILRHARSDAVNYGLETEAVVARLKQLDEQYGIDIFQAETDTVQLELEGEVDDWHALAQQLYELCPDSVDQGVGSVEELEDLIAGTRRVYLWWD